MVEPPGDERQLDILRGAVENTNEAFVTIDEHHRVLFFNRAAEEIFGYSRDEVLGHDLTAIMTPRCARDHRRAVDRYVRTRAPRRIVHVSEITATRKSGQAFPADISFSVSEQGGKRYFTGIVRDLTETRALQEQVRRAERLAALGHVVAEITHEIKNPLMMIGGLARQLLRAAGDEKIRRKLQIITEEVSRLEALLKELRLYYQPRALEAEEVELRELMTSLQSLIAEDCRRDGIRLDVALPRESLPVLGDRDKLQQVFLNLTKNAIEAMPDGGRLRIKAERRKDHAEVVIADTGCGISGADKEKIFSPFYTTKKQGSGLGLSLSKRIVEDHHRGRLQCRSEQGKGAVFTVSLPLDPGATPRNA